MWQKKRILANLNMELKRYKLGEIGEIRMCKRILKEETNSVGGVPFFKIGTFGGQADVFIAKEKFEEYKNAYSYPKKGDVLISAAGTIGRTVVFDGKDAYFQDSNIVWIENDESKVLNEYLFYCYKNIRWTTSVGSTILRLYNDDIRNTDIIVPPLSEQKKIASVLSALDDKIALNKKMNQKLEAMAKRLYDYWFVQYDFPDKNGRPYKTTGGPMTYNPTLKREIPEGWEVKSIEDFCKIFTGKKDVNQSLDKGKYKFYSCAPGFRFSNEKLYEGKAILISGNGSYTGRTIFVDDAFDLYQRTYAVILKETEENILEYIYYTMKKFLSLKVSGGTHGSAIPYIVYDDIAKEKFTFSVSVVENFQKCILPIVDNMIKNEKEIQKLTDLRDRLLPLLMNRQVITV